MTSSAARPSSTLCIALIGNPNTGKSTLFTALCGVRQRVGNYPGVTVEKKLGHCSHGSQRWTLVDLPGTYSLAPRSPDEMVTVDVLLGRQAGEVRPEAVLCIVDATNLERNLYLVSQVLELGLPTVMALNMTDLARERGIEIDVAALSERLGVSVVPIQANRREGLDALREALAASSLSAAPRTAGESPFPAAFQAAVQRLTERLTGRLAVSGTGAASAEGVPRFLAERLLLDTSGYLESRLLGEAATDARQEVKTAREQLQAAGVPVPGVEAMARYGWIGKALEGVVRRPSVMRRTAGDRLDRVLTHWFSGSLVFLLAMLLVFQAVFSWAGPLMGWIDSGTEAVKALADSQLADGALKSLVIDGLIAGVGGVVIFLPQIMILFLFIGALEDCGYMARAAYLMDKLMTPLGLSGKSFIPLLSSFACAIPGIMAARVIENRRDRFTTMLVAPLMSCSARLPVYALLTAAFIPTTRYTLPHAWGDWTEWVGISLQGLVVVGMYLLGMITAALVALSLKRTLLRGPTPPFVMELPSYKVPSAATVLYRAGERGWIFIQRAGTLIVVVSVLVWAGLYYPQRTEELANEIAPHRDELVAQLDALGEDDPAREPLATALADLDNQISGAQQRQSILGQMGHWVEPIVRPLGWDWRLGCAAIASLPAREVVVATLGVLYNQGDDTEADEFDTRLQGALKSATWDGTERPVFNTPVALSVMVFFALCAQCVSTLAILRRETASWRWPIFAFVYMTLLAYVGAWATYQLGMRWLGA